MLISALFRSLLSCFYERKGLAKEIKTAYDAITRKGLSTSIVNIDRYITVNIFDCRLYFAAQGVRSDSLRSMPDKRIKVFFNRRFHWQCGAYSMYPNIFFLVFFFLKISSKKKTYFCFTILMLQRPTADCVHTYILVQSYELLYNYNNDYNGSISTNITVQINRRLFLCLSENTLTLLQNREHYLRLHWCRRTLST